jgi:DNA sulfur modification protein DndD
MYLAKLHLQNWRTYSDVTFEFAEPTARRSVVLIGAMNGHGKTSFLMSLYLGLFGRFGLRYCEGFSKENEPDAASYRQAIERYRRNVAPGEEPTTVDVTLAPTIGDSTDEEEVRVVRRWYFSGQNKAKQGESFEEVDVYVGGRLQKNTSLDKDPLVLAYERVERNLFPAHVAPAFFFDGDQAQKLIENTGEAGLKKAVEVMFGTKVIAEVAQRVGEHIVRLRQKTGGKQKSSEKQLEVESKIKQREELNAKIAKLQADHLRLEREKEEKERERSNLQIQLAQMGGSGAADAVKLQGEFVRIEREVTDAERALAESVRSLGIALAMSRLAPAIAGRLKAEESREAWEGLKRGTLENKEKVLFFAMPEPPEADALLGDLDPVTRVQVRERFADALERIYNPPPPESAKEYLLGHVKGDARSRVVTQLAHVQAGASVRATTSAKRLRDARELQDDIKAKMALIHNLPQQTQEIRERLDVLNDANQELSRKLGLLEGEVRKLKADLYTLNEDIGRIQEELARLGPEQKRIAVAERVGRALDALQEQLKPTTTSRLEEFVTKYFLKIADPHHFRGGRIRLPSGGPPEFEWSNGIRLALESISGFEKRSFGIGFSLALADIIRRRIPLVIDTPLGNADSKYRPRTLHTLTDFDLDQVIILTHDEEVTTELVDLIRPSLLQTFLVEKGDDKGSKVYPNRYFPSRP